MYSLFSTADILFWRQSTKWERSCPPLW